MNSKKGHGELLKEMCDHEKPSFVENGDDTLHPITHVENVTLFMHSDKVKYLADVFHVQNIRKNLAR